MSDALTEARIRNAERLGVEMNHQRALDALRAENAALRADLKRARSAHEVGKRASALAEESRALRDLCTEVEDFMTTKTGKALLGVAFRSWLKRFRALKGKR